MKCNHIAILLSRTFFVFLLYVFKLYNGFYFNFTIFLKQLSILFTMLD